MTNNLNRIKFVKQTPEQIEEKNINNKEFEKLCDFARLLKINKDPEKINKDPEKRGRSYRNRANRNRKKN